VINKSDVEHALKETRRLEALGMALPDPELAKRVMERIAGKSNELKIKGQTYTVRTLGDLAMMICRLRHEQGIDGIAAEKILRTGQKYGLLDADGKATEKYFAMATEAVAQLARELAGQAPIAEVTFKDFSNLAKRRGHTPESLAPLFRGKIEEPREFFERVISCRRRGEDLSDTVIPYRSVIEFYRKETCSFMEMRPNQRTCACGCRQPVFDRKKWASPGCRQRFVRRKKAPDVHFASV
jgi:hypothetical protein